MQNTLMFLLIDDDTDDHELFQIALKDADPDISCLTETNGTRGLEFLRSGAPLPDCIFLDLNMPMMGGRECLVKLKEDPVLREIPVVICSTSSNPNDKTETLALGAVDFITKPTRMSEMTNLLYRFISAHLHPQTARG